MNEPLAGVSLSMGWSWCRSSVKPAGTSQASKQAVEASPPTDRWPFEVLMLPPACWAASSAWCSSMRSGVFKLTLASLQAVSIQAREKSTNRPSIHKTYRVRARKKTYWGIISRGIARTSRNRARRIIIGELFSGRLRNYVVALCLFSCFGCSSCFVGCVVSEKKHNK